MRVCDAIWKVLHKEQLPLPTTDMWLANASKFELLWNFPHCAGAVDGKHIVMQAPPNSGSTFYSGCYIAAFNRAAETLDETAVDSKFHAY